MDRVDFISEARKLGHLEGLKEAMDMARAHRTFVGSSEGAATSIEQSIASRIKELEGWQQIETAPKDGTVFLGWGEAENFPQPMRYYFEETGFDVWVYADELLDEHAGQVWPTHWRPMPAVPSRSRGKVERPIKRKDVI